MLPSLGALPLVHTSAKDDVLTEILDEQRDALHKTWEVAEEEKEEEAMLESQLGEMRAELYAKEQALRETHRSEKRAAPVRKEVFDNKDLLEEVLLALDKGDDSWEVCKIVARWCSLNKAHSAACDDRFWNGTGERIWGEQVHTWWQGDTPQKRFAYACKTEHEFRIGEKKLDRPLRNLDDFNNVKRLVLAAIAASPSIAPGDPGPNSYRTLQWASDRLRDDEDVVRAAVAKDARAIRFASRRLQALVKMPPTAFWPPAEPTDFERQWGEKVLWLLLYQEWSTLTLKGIRVRLGARHPELGANYFRITHREEFKDLVNRLMAHFFAP